ncbi:2,5-diketo-D-gluconate reductase A [Austwickia chelonae]|uniref:Putative aldo/keto reductase n=2 Tax=Austwickia TaxID=1184606 RepID=K6V3T9_9MICO|nr:putative aldo/keto reductase [Austwickia chelonae NBRC 105200]SEW30572.1 2,5-diketo-D-gluconate reductase A [Austwickia chelonae]
MPRLGYGVYQIEPEDAARCATEALRMGYRSVDTAAFYGNEEGVGRAVVESGLPREEIFVTTKVWNDAHGFDETLRAFEESLARLGLEQVDLYLIHWPCPAREKYVDSWRALLRLQEEGRIRAAGVSNFEPEHLRRLAEETGQMPAVNQIELHPYLQQRELKTFHGEQGIATEAWSPLARAGDLFAEPTVTRIAEEAGVTPAQVVLAWHLAQGNVVIPKSVTPERMAENLAAVDVTLTPAQIDSLDALDRGGRMGPDPREFNG